MCSSERPQLTSAPLPPFSLSFASVFLLFLSIHSLTLWFLSNGPPNFDYDHFAIAYMFFSYLLNYFIFFHTSYSYSLGGKNYSIRLDTSDDRDDIDENHLFIT